MNLLARRPVVLALVLLAFATGFHKAFQRPPAAPFAAQPAMPLNQEAPRWQSRFVSAQPNVQSHAASLVELRDGRVRAFWFSGSREGAKDVQIYTAVFNPARGEWSPAHPMANSRDIQRGLLRYVKKLGNPVAARAADGTLRLFFVTVSLGGWAGSSITWMNSGDEGETWSEPRRLITSPFLNLSTLVKGAPFLYADGTLGLPVYHELFNKFGELLRVDPAGRVIDKQRLSDGNYSLQPVLLIQDAQRALALMRYSGPERPHRVIGSASSDGGQHWSRPAKLPLANPNAALSGVVLADGRMVVALNNIEENREVLSLVVSADGGASWNTVELLENQYNQRLERSQYQRVAAELARQSDASVRDGTPYAESALRQQCRAQGCDFEFSYPYLIQTRQGDLHLVYTWNRSYIKHIQFTPAWLDRHPGSSAHAELH